MSEKLRNNLNFLMRQMPISADELARRAGIPASTIKKIRNSNDSNPTLSTLAPLADFFSLTISQLIGNVSSTTHSLPLINWQDAIHWPEITQQTFSMISSEHDYSQNAYALRVEENDWEHLAKDTLLLVDPLVKAEHRDLVIVYKSGQEIPTLKQILIDDERTYLKPMTRGYHVALCTSEHQILGVVVEYKKHLKKQFA